MGNYIFNGTIYLIAIVFLIISFIKSRQKTKKALIKAWNSFKNILPMLLGIITVIGLMLAILDPEIIKKIIGEKSGALGVLLSSIVGSVTLLPGVVAFSTAALLLSSGAGYIQIAAFVQTLMMVGIVTLPMEIKYFNKKIAILRNAISFILSIGVAYLIGFILGIWK
ncbi:MAG: permease [Candidatus Hydromicrobium americanum]|nr:MAG: permease [Candidatus Hydromicrobium americanum]